MDHLPIFLLGLLLFLYVPISHVSKAATKKQDFVVSEALASYAYLFLQGVFATLIFSGL